MAVLKIAPKNISMAGHFEGNMMMLIVNLLFIRIKISINKMTEYLIHQSGGQLVSSDNIFFYSGKVGGKDILKLVLMVIL